MPKFDIKIMLLNLLSTAAISIFLIYTLIQIQVITRSPFQLGNQYTEMSISLSEPMADADAKRLSQKLWTYIKQNEIGTIVQNMDALGLGLYDPKEKYASYSLTSGHYFEYMSSTRSPVILARQGSFIDQYSQNQNHTYEIGDQTYHVIGSYSTEYPLYTESTDYIIPLYELDDIRGTYFLATQNQAVIGGIVKLFENEDLNVSITSSGFKKSSSYVANQLIHTTIYMITCIGLVFIFSNFYVFYLFHLIKFRKVNRIHHIFGGTSSSILRRSYPFVFWSISSGSVLGASLYIFFLDFGKLSFSIPTLLAIILTNTLLSSMLYILAFYSKARYSKFGGGV